MHIWRILSAVSAGVCVIGLILLLVLRLLKNGYYHQFVADEMYKKVKAANSVNTIYFTSGETKNFIKKYAVCKTVYDKYLVCNYAARYGEISYFVILYSHMKRVIGVLNVKHRDTGDSSNVISLKRNCAFVNVVIGSADGVTVNSEVIRPLPMSRVRLNSAIKSLVLFTFLFAVRHAAVELFGGIYTKQFLDNVANYGIIAASFVLAVLSYFISALCFRKRNAKILNGGFLEYEFV